MNCTDEQYSYVLSATDDGRKPKCKYVAIAKENAPTTGTRHFHAVLYFKDAQQPKVIRNKFRDMISEPCKPKATLQHQLEYISKGEDSVLEESGERPNPDPNHGRHKGGDSNAEKWERTRELARAGRLEEIDACHYITQYGNLKRIARDNVQKPDDLPLPARKVHFEWWYGPPGVGKSKAAKDLLIELYGEDGWYDKPPQNHWIGETCKAEDAWRINDFDAYKSKHLGGLLKTWAEESPFEGEVKGGGQWYRPKKIIVTSNPAPWEIWDDAHTLSAIMSRFKIVYWPEVYTPSMPKPDPRVDEIHPPWTWTYNEACKQAQLAEEEAERLRQQEIDMLREDSIPRPVLRRTEPIVDASIDWSPGLIDPISDEENRDNIRKWIQQFEDGELTRAYAPNFNFP